MLANEKQFSETLTKIGDLYEEGKDCLFAMSSPEVMNDKNYNRLFAILAQMRDLAAVALKANHKVSDN